MVVDPSPSPLGRRMRSTHLQIPMCMSSVYHVYVKGVPCICQVCRMYMSSVTAHIHPHNLDMQMYMWSVTSHIHGTLFNILCALFPYTSYNLDVYIVLQHLLAHTSYALHIYIEMNTHLQIPRIFISFCWCLVRHVSLQKRPTSTSFELWQKLLKKSLELRFENERYTCRFPTYAFSSKMSLEVR